MYVKMESSAISFGKLSDPHVADTSPLSSDDIRLRDFTTTNIQNIVDQIAQMFGYKRGQIQAKVERKDRILVWQKNGSGIGSLQFTFIIEANIAPYQRITQYGKHFLYEVAQKHGKEIIFGIIGHEIGHVMAEFALNEIVTAPYRGKPAIIFKNSLHPYWDELMADFLAGVVMAKAIPPLDPAPLKNFLFDTVEGESHPAGFWRVKAIEMGTQWVKGKSPMLSDKILLDQSALGYELKRTAEQYYKDIYLRLDIRNRYRLLPEELLISDGSILKYL